MELCVLFITVPNAEVGERVARALVEERLAACVNRVPGLTSIYRWQGKIECDPEELLVVKTRQSLVPELAARVQALHPYQVPEVIALPIVAGLPSYLDWVAAETRDGSQRPSA
ncbi:MAG: divalent-cation tolerance protein CutA [candidate division FCPU426 bacterium]